MTSTNNLIGSIDISPNTDFTNGINLNFSAIVGSEGKDLLSTLPSYFSSNPVTYSIQLNINDPENGPMIVSTLESIKDMILAMVPGDVSNGVSVNIRHIGSSVNIDIGIVGDFANIVKAKLAEFKLDLSSFSESGQFSIISGLSLKNALDSEFDDLLKRASQFKVQGSGQMPTKLLMDSIIESVVKGLGNALTGQMKLGFKVFKAMSALRRIQYSSKYDSNIFYEYLREIAGRMVHNIMGGGEMDELNHEMGVQIAGSVLAQTQETAKEQISVMKQPVMMFAEPYMETIKALNFDEISISATVAEYGAMLKFKICLVGLNDFLNSYVLN